MLARKPVAWGATAAVLTPANLRRLRDMPEAFDQHASVCEAPPRPAAGQAPLPAAGQHAGLPVHAPGPDEVREP